ncbi:MAG: DUF1232 domain-containing protein [Planctomycetes bacterium]|nr:DUF1232 domain-containing protein [Planctomycetota bacterium]
MANNLKPKAFKIANGKAKKYVKDPEKTKILLKKAMNKAKHNKGSLGKIWGDLMALFRLVGAWAKGEYKDVPMKVILLMISAIIYFLMPFDLIPDFIPVAGYLDDAAVLAYVIKSAGDYLETFSAWEKLKTQGLSGNVKLAG